MTGFAASPHPPLWHPSHGSPWAFLVPSSLPPCRPGFEWQSQLRPHSLTGSCGSIATTHSHDPLQKIVAASILSQCSQGPADSRHTASSDRLGHAVGLSLGKVALWPPACVWQGLCLGPCPVRCPLDPYNSVIFPSGALLPKLAQISFFPSINGASSLLPSWGCWEAP